MDENILNLKKGLDDDIRRLDESRIQYASRLIRVGRHDEAEAQLNEVRDKESKLFIHTRKQLTLSTVNLKPSFIEGNLANQFLEVYNKTVDEQFGGNDALKIFNLNEGVITGSSTYATTLAGKILRGNFGIRIPTQAGLERIRSRDDLDLSGFYVDTSLVLRSEEDPNEYLAKNIAEQIRQRQELQLPAMINLVDCYLENDDKAPNGLRPVLEDNANIIYAPILNHESEHFDSEDINENGLPTKVEGGDRYLYTRSFGLSRLYLVRGEGLGSRYGGLAVSDRVGRVILQGGGATRTQD